MRDRIPDGLNLTVGDFLRFLKTGEEMTEQEKMLELLRMMAEQKKEDRLAQLKQASEAIREMYESLIVSGFTAPQAMDLTKTMIANCMPRGK